MSPQINKSDEIASRTAARLEEAKRKAQGEPANAFDMCPRCIMPKLKSVV